MADIEAIEPMVVSPRQASLMLGMGITRVYELMASGELESFKDGKSRRIVVASMRRRIERLVEQTSAGATLATD